MGDNKPDNFELAMIGLDALIYGLTDYSHNIELLQTIRAQMLTCGYKDSDLEIHVIDELIEEYKNKWGEAIGSALAEIAADTIVTIATKHPALSAVKVASDLAMMLSPIDEKAEWLALSCYRDALKKCIYPVNDLYVNGKITTDKEELKQYVSLYLHMQLKAHELAYDIARYSPDDNADKIIILQSNISALTNIINTYFI